MDCCKHLIVVCASACKSLRKKIFEKRKNRNSKRKCSCASCEFVQQKIDCCVLIGAFHCDKVKYQIWTVRHKTRIKWTLDWWFSGEEYKVHQVGWRNKTTVSARGSIFSSLYYVVSLVFKVCLFNSCSWYMISLTLCHINVKSHSWLSANVLRSSRKRFGNERFQNTKC